MPRNPTPAQIEAARRNGARSRGPNTAAGKARSALNATTHGLTSRRLTLPAAPPEFLQAFVNGHHPANPAELHLVRAIADASWHLRWCWAQEHALYGDLAPIDAYQKHHAAFPVLWNLEGRCHRVKERLSGQLTQLRRTSRNTSNEPKPAQAAAGQQNHSNEPNANTQADPKHSNEPKPAQATGAGQQNHNNEPKPAQAAGVGQQNHNNEPNPHTQADLKHSNEPKQAHATQSHQSEPNTDLRQQWRDIFARFAAERPWRSAARASIGS